MKPVEPARVLLIDDHTLLRQSLRQVLSAEPDLVVVGDTGDIDEAVTLVAATAPDVVLLGGELLDSEVAEAVRRIATVSPDARVIVLSMSDRPADVRDLLDLGVRGFMLKSVSRYELLAAIRGVYSRDQSTLAVSQHSLAQLSRQAAVTLSDRELEVLVLAAQALTNFQIGSRLGIAEGTVKRHLRNVFGKLGAVSRIDAVNKAVAASLIPVPTRTRGTPLTAGRQP